MNWTYSDVYMKHVIAATITSLSTMESTFQRNKIFVSFKIFLLFSFPVYTLIHIIQKTPINRIISYVWGILLV